MWVNKVKLLQKNRQMTYSDVYPEVLLSALQITSQAFDEILYSVLRTALQKKP